PRAVYQAADVAVQADEGQAGAAGTQLGGILFALVEQLFDIGMAKQGVVVESDLGVEHNHFPFGRDDKRVDLGQAAVLVKKDLRQGQHDLLSLGDLFAAEAELESEPARLEWLHALLGADRDLED